MYPETKVHDLLHFFRDFTAPLPDSVTTMGGIIDGPPGTPLEGQNAGWIGVCHSGPAGEGEKLLQPIKDFGGAAIDTIGPTSFQTIQAMFGTGDPPGGRNYWRSQYISELPDELIDVVIEGSEGMPRPGTIVYFDHLGGAIARVGNRTTGTASGHGTSVTGCGHSQRAADTSIS